MRGLDRGWSPDPNYRDDADAGRKGSLLFGSVRFNLKVSFNTSLKM